MNFRVFRIALLSLALAVPYGSAARAGGEFAAMLRASLDAYDPAAAPAAKARASEAFFRFEESSLDKELALRDPALYRELEEEWTGLVADMDRREPVSAVRARGERVLALLEEAERRASSASSAFFDSLLIILREGFEAILVVSALAAYLRKVGAASRLPWLYGGAAAAVAASLGLWLLARTVVEVSGAAREALEGSTMLVAAAVLFWVSYWLVSKAEAARWQAFVKKAASAALGRGALAGFGFLSFIVVFREGFETVLFYEALLARAGRATAAVVSGFGAGAVALGGVWLLGLRLGARIPLGPFFAVTGGLLYFLAFKFAGAGVFELQAAQVLSRTPLPGFPDRPWLRDWFGIYPSVEGLSLQAVFVLLAALAAAVAVAGRRVGEPRTAEEARARRVAGGG